MYEIQRCSLLQRSVAFVLIFIQVFS